MNGISLSCLDKAKSYILLSERSAGRALRVGNAARAGSAADRIQYFIAERTEVHSEVVRAVEQAARCSKASATRRGATPQIDDRAPTQSYLHMYFEQIPAALSHAKAQARRPAA